MRRKTKNTLKTIALAVVGVGALIGGASAINSLVNKADEDLKVIHPIFEVGGIDETTGKYVDDDGTIYTKEAFECQGLQIKLDFEDTIKYEVFFYDNSGNFMSTSGIQDDSTPIEKPQMATHARIEITPDWVALGEDYEDEETQVIKWYQVSKYSSQMEIKVSKEQQVYQLQDFETLSLTNSIFSVKNGVYFNDKGEEVSLDTYNSYIFTATEDCKIYLDCSNSATYWQYNVNIDDTFTRYVSDKEGFIYGKKNCFDLKEGDSIYVSIMKNCDLATVTFNIATYDFS